MLRYFLVLCFSLFFCSCASVQKVAIHHYYRVAVMDFKGTADKPEAGNKMASMLVSRFIQNKYYEVMEREQIDKILNERKLTLTTAENKDNLNQLGKLLSVDAIIFGNVANYKVEEYKGKEMLKDKLTEEARGTKTIQADETKTLLDTEAQAKTLPIKEEFLKKIGLGEIAKELLGKKQVPGQNKEEPKEIPGGETKETKISEPDKTLPEAQDKTLPIKEEFLKKIGLGRETSKEITEKNQVERQDETKTREVLLEQEQIAKKGIVSADVRMVDVNTAGIVQSKSDTRTAVMVATNTQQALQLPSNEAILELLATRVANNLSNSLAPNNVGKVRFVHKGKDALTKLGMRYAQQGLWEEATDSWQKAISLNQNNAYAHNNLGVAYEREGKYESAIVEYKKALELRPEEKVFMENLASARKDAERK